VGASFTFSTANFENPKELDRKIERAALAVVKYHDGNVEKYMKHNAPWRDRTSNARNGLFAVGRRISKGLYAIILGHSVDYGVYLEEGTEHMRARPIIEPAMQVWAPKVMATFSKILDRL
jgi:HK97 gp10 family phage protein